MRISRVKLFLNDTYLWRGLLLLLLLLVVLWSLLAWSRQNMLGMRMMMGMKALWRRLVALKGPEGPRNEFWCQRVQDISLLELQSLQLSLDLLEGDSMQASVFMADGNEVLPKFPGRHKKKYIKICLTKLSSLKPVLKLIFWISCSWTVKFQSVTDFDLLSLEIWVNNPPILIASILLAWCWQADICQQPERVILDMWFWLALTNHSHYRDGCGGGPHQFKPRLFSWINDNPHPTKGAKH